MAKRHGLPDIHEHSRKQRVDPRKHYHIEVSDSEGKPNRALCPGCRQATMSPWEKITDPIHRIVMGNHFRSTCSNCGAREERT